MIVTKEGDKLCGYSPAPDGHVTVGLPLVCTLPHGHGGDGHRVDWPVWEALFRDGYAYVPDPPAPGPCFDSRCFLPDDHDGAHVRAWFGSSPARPKCRAWHDTYGSCERPLDHPGWHGRTPGGADTPNIWPKDPP